jgi:hypothetical protein
MHASEGGFPILTGPQLLRAMTSTDLCLTCHATMNGAVLSPIPTQPSPEIGGGNFTFLYENNINDASGAAFAVIGGNHAGHNVVSPAWGLVEDSDHPVAPGGTFSALDLGCTSCHDPHDESSFRMLRGVGPFQGGYVFGFPAPQAEGNPLTVTEHETSHTAYQSGWSQWCANCHGLYHDSGNAAFVHPVNDTLGTAESDSYSNYRGEADPYGTQRSVAYIPEVPFEDPAMRPSSTNGPTPASRVICMSCHRAHATSAPEATRWDKTVLYLDDDGRASGSYPIRNPYPDPSQRSLCIKCHVDKTRDHGLTQPCLECH